MEDIMKRVVPCLWFDDQAQEAVDFYMTVFNDGRVGNTSFYSDAGKEIHGHEAGDVLTIDFEIEGQPFMALNGGPNFTVNPSISFSVGRRTVQEVDALWDKLSVGGTVLIPLGTHPFSQRYGWVNDKFGVSWQVILAEDMTTPGGILPSLLFTGSVAGKAEEAMKFYTSIFPDSSIDMTLRHGADQAPDIEGTIAYGEFSIFGQKLSVMDSAREHDFAFNEAVSLVVTCETQAEIDEYWDKLSAVPEAEACGWLKDKYGVSWQIVPSVMNEMMAHGTAEQLEHVMAAFMQMKKFDVAELQRVYDQAA
jgi:predicted 3-demethylubiquinone-9 3-methyltransferase (glyoxalase superfamily)